MALKTGERVVAESERATEHGRGGVIEEVLREDPPRYRIRWDDGHVSIYSPAAGALRADRPQSRAR